MIMKYPVLFMHPIRNPAKLDSVFRFFIGFETDVQLRRIKIGTFWY